MADGKSGQSQFFLGVSDTYLTEMENRSGQHGAGVALLDTGHQIVH
jgi:hypothetical protein